MRIDLHTHTTSSDGTLRPRDLMAHARETGLDIIALTDHDTTAGWVEAAEALPPGLTLVPGAELSCRYTAPDGRVIGLHMLALLFDPTDAALATAMRDVRTSRLHRAERMVAALVADGAPLTWDEVAERAQGASVGRPHIAAALVARGVVPTVDAAFRSEWLGERYRIEKADIDVFDAIDLVHNAGGVTVFAHPRAEKRGAVVTDAVIAELADAGLDAIEVDHPDHTADQRAATSAVAKECGLLTTGSSDFHGSHKTTKLGAEATDPEVYAALVARADSVPIRA